MVDMHVVVKIALRDCFETKVRLCKFVLCSNKYLLLRDACVAKLSKRDIFGLALLFPSPSPTPRWSIVAGLGRVIGIL